MKRKNSIILAIVFVGILVAAIIAYGRFSENISPESVSSEIPSAGFAEAPDFTFLDIEGKEISLSDFRGKPVVLNFWASWCPPCKSEMPEFDKVFTELGNEVKFVMLALTDGQRETIESASSYAEGQGFSFPVYFDAFQEGAYSFGINSIPTTFFIDKDGNILDGAIGAIDEHALRAGIGLIQ